MGTAVSLSPLPSPPPFFPSASPIVRCDLVPNILRQFLLKLLSKTCPRHRTTWFEIWPVLHSALQVSLRSKVLSLALWPTGRPLLSAGRLKVSCSCRDLPDLSKSNPKSCEKETEKLKRGQPCPLQTAYSSSLLGAYRDAVQPVLPVKL